MIVNINPTVTGGTAKTLTSSGPSGPGKVSFVSPDHTRLKPRVIDFGVTNPNPQRNGDPGVARTTVKLTWADRETAEGCCTVSTGSNIIDLSIRQALNQDEALLIDELAYFRAIVNSTEFTDLWQKGILPV